MGSQITEISWKSWTLDSCISFKSATTALASSTSKRGSKTEISSYSSWCQYDCVEPGQSLCTCCYYGICVWNAADGSLVHSLTGHTASSYVLDVHPFNPRIAMSAGYDGRTIVWDIWEGIPIRTYEIGRFKLVDGKFSPDGTSIVLSDDVGQIYFLNTGQGESQKDAKYDQFFLGDYRPLIQDTQGNVLDQETQLPPHRRNIQEPLCDSSMVPYPEPYQSQFQQRRLGALGIEWRPSLIKYTVGPDFSVDQDYPVIPLVDLEGMIEPQPEFIDAMFWEPEYDIVVSDDTDSEYNVNEDNSSAAEQGSVSAISSSDLECSEDDSSNRDGLRRSRRKKHNVEVEVMTSSGRRVRKRNLDECNGNTSGSNRTKKSKGSSKSSKRKSSKAKKSRPQRAAAHNARNMLSQFGETSTDGEDNYSDDESSDSFQDSDDLSEPERKIDNKRDERKEPFLEKFANVSRPPAHTESQTNVESRPRLVVKFSLRDSKKNVPIEDTRLACETRADILCQSSRPQAQESDKKCFSDKSSVDPVLSTDATDAKLPESHNRHENSYKTQAGSASDNLDASMCFEANADQCRKMKRRTYELSSSGDVLLTGDVDDHLEHNANGRSEHMINTELADFDDAPKFSSPEPLFLGNHQPNVDDSLTSSYDKFNGGDKGQSGSGRCGEDSLENNEVVHSSNSLDLKMKAPVKSTKLVIKKKPVSADTEGPCKLKFVCPKADPTGARGNLISGNSSFTGPNIVMEVPEDEDDRKFSSSELLNSYSDKRSYDHVHEGGKSYRGEVDPDGFDCDLKENTSVFSNQRGLGIGLPDLVGDPIRRTRSIRVKTTSEEPSTSNRRIKIRGGQSSRGTSDREDSSIKVSDQLHRRTRSGRNRHGEYIANDPGILTQRVLNHHVKKLSWLMLSEHEEGYRYIPQLGDEVVYLRQGHQEYIESCMLSESGPWRSFPGLSASEICKVEELEYAELPGSGDSCCKLKLKFVDPSSYVHGKSFKLTLPELINFSDFVVEKTWYDTAMKRNWSSRDKCMVWWRNEDGKGGSWWDGRIISVQAKSQDFPDSPWERYLIQYKTDPTENHLHSPWELYDLTILWEHPHIDHDIRDKLLAYFTKLEEKFDIQALNQIAEKSEFSNRFPVPFYPELIQSRLNNDYYRSVEGVKHDIMVMLSNAEDFFTITNNVQLLSKVRRISGWFRRRLERI
ncbi:bromodomain and WD repeat-containing protein 3-like [Abrus precatorius]|uniref:Bromodomain and WD repeat-containing protein 3-like n=1 Tax=Abrus precatorius TaxID=3816 RepID=A0A8B8M6B7_ABRPR|nr:bromodomain and WD repeat-containing protein 3-like [Abrus precatorius]